MAPAHADAPLAALAATHAFVAEAFVPVAVPHWPEPALRAVARAVLGGAARTPARARARALSLTLRTLTRCSAARP